MKISLFGETYPVGNVTYETPVGVVLQLKKVSGGLTIKRIRDSLVTAYKQLSIPDGDEDDEQALLEQLLEDEEFAKCFQGLVWLVGRTYAKRDWSWAEAGEQATLGLLVQMTNTPDDGDVEEDDEDEDADPKVNGVAVAGALPTR